MNNTINIEGLDLNRKTCYGADFCAVLRDDLRRRNVKGVTVRCGRSSWTDSVIATVTLSAPDLVGKDRPEYVNPYHLRRDDFPEITDAAYNRIAAAVKIIQSYNWDDSDPMRDHFDVGFYFDLRLRVKA